MHSIGSFFLFMLFMLNSASAQYFYKDVITAQQAADDNRLYKSNKVKRIIISSFEADGSPSDDFFCEKKISKDYQKSELYTRSGMAEPSLMTSTFDKNGKLTTTYDSSSISSTFNSYQYNTSSNIAKVESVMRSADDDFVNEIREEHIYVYSNEKLEKIQIVKNTTDTITILVLTDEKNNVTVEKNTKTGNKYYYYYDDKNRLTDIVHATEVNERLIPDYMFEYNKMGELTQMTTIEEGSNYYFIWKYAYENGMRTKEKCYNKERKLMGSVTYEYK